jgi:hypothetical protein
MRFARVVAVCAVKVKMGLVQGNFKRHAGLSGLPELHGGD